MGLIFSSSAEENSPEHWLEAYQEDMELFSFEGYRIQRYRSPTPPHSQFAQTLDTQGVITLRESNPDVVLLDWNMPVMDGLEFLKALRALENVEQPRVVFCTTENDMAHIRTAIEAGADEYIMKPFDREIIEAKFSQVGLI